MFLSAGNSNDAFTSRAALLLSSTTVLMVGGFKEQSCVIWGVIVSIYITVVQGKTVGPRDTVNRVKDNEVDYLFTHLAPRVIIPFRYAAKTPSIRGPFEKDVISYELLTCGVEKCKHGGGWWYKYRLEARGGEDE